MKTSIKKLSGVPEKLWNNLSWEKKLLSLNSRKAKRNIKQFIKKYGKSAGSEVLGYLLPIFSTLGSAAQATATAYAITMKTVIPLTKGIMKKVESATFPPPVGIATAGVNAVKQGAGVSLVYIKQASDKIINESISKISETEIDADQSKLSQAPINENQILSVLNNINQSITVLNNITSKAKTIGDGIKAGVEGFTI